MGMPIRRVYSAGVFLTVLIFYSPSFAQDWHFEDVAETAGMQTTPSANPAWTGVSVVDFDNDGWEDIFLCRAGGPQQFFRNKGDGTFEDITNRSGITSVGENVMTALFFDYDGDGWLDLLAANRLTPGDSTLFRNKRDGSFEAVEGNAGITPTRQITSAAAGDYDLDGDVDVYTAVNQPAAGNGQLWRNNGDGTFTDAGVAAGIRFQEAGDEEFTPSFTDVNNDGWPDLLIVADHQMSQIYLNNGDGTFQNASTDVLTDEGGMGSAIGDYDNDGDLDWFVSSIWDPDQNPFRPWGVSSGNRLYRNNGDGTFEDATDEAGVREGFWGWGSIFCDFNNDGHLDLFHTNGFIDIQGPFFQTDPARMFVANGDHTFTERSEELGLDDRGLGNGVAVWDYDQDGDQDLFVANSTGASRLFRNNGGNQLGSVTVKTVSNLGNSFGLGAKVYLRTGDSVQMREIRGGSNFLSQNPHSAHFGMGSHESGDVEIVWPGGRRTMMLDVKPGERLVAAELPVNYDNEDLSFYQYYFQVRESLKGYVRANRLSQSDAARVQASAVKSFVQNRWPGVSQ